MSEHIFTSSFQSGPALQTPKVGCTMVLMLLMPFCLASFQQEQGQANELAETLTRHQLQGVTLCTCYTHVVCIWSNRGSPGVLSTPSCWQPPVMHWISEQAPPWLWLCFWPWAQAQKRPFSAAADLFGAPWSKDFPLDVLAAFALGAFGTACFLGGSLSGSSLDSSSFAFGSWSCHSNSRPQSCERLILFRRQRTTWPWRRQSVLLWKDRAGLVDFHPSWCSRSKISKGNRFCIVQLSNACLILEGVLSKLIDFERVRLRVFITL